MNEKANTLQGILPKTDTPTVTDNGRNRTSVEGRGSLGDGQTSRSDSKGKGYATTLAYLIRFYGSELKKIYFLNETSV